MDKYENYKAMAKEFFRLKNRLAKIEESEGDLAILLATIGCYLKEGWIENPDNVKLLLSQIDNLLKKRPA